MNIIKFLSRNKMSQNDLAKLLDVTAANVNKWVNGKGYPSYECCKKMMGLGIYLDELFDDEILKIYNKNQENADISNMSIPQDKITEGVKKALVELMGLDKTTKEK